MQEKFRFIGFCGADDSVDPDLLQIISLHYPWIEWGVLFRSDLEGTARYASPDWVHRFSQVAKSSAANGHPMNLAAHLCFDRCQQILDGDSSFVRELFQLGFRRVQVNITKANGTFVEEKDLPGYVVNIRKCMRENAEIEWLFQLNEETLRIWELLRVDLPVNVSVLHDASCGKGVVIETFPSPAIYPSVPSGYAGGIGPNNIASILRTLDSIIVDASSLSKPVWIDMESSLRTIIVENQERKDIFDINKCMKCVKSAIELGFQKL